MIIIGEKDMTDEGRRDRWGRKRGRERSPEGRRGGRKGKKRIEMIGERMEG